MREMMARGKASWEEEGNGEGTVFEKLQMQHAELVNVDSDSDSDDEETPRRKMRA